MVNFNKITTSLTQKGINYSFFEKNGLKILSYDHKGKCYNQIYDKVGKLVNQTIENPANGEKITAEINRIGNDFTSIYKTKNSPMGYFTHNINLNRKELNGTKWTEIKSVKEGSNGEFSEKWTNVLKHKDGTIQVF